MSPCQNRGLPKTVLGGNWRKPCMPSGGDCKIIQQKRHGGNSWSVTFKPSSLTPIPKLNRAGKNRTKASADASPKS